MGHIPPIPPSRFGYFVKHLRIAMANTAVLRRVGIPGCGHPNHETAEEWEPPDVTSGFGKTAKTNQTHILNILSYTTTHHDPKDLKILVYGTPIWNMFFFCNRGPQAFNPTFTKFFRIASRAPTYQRFTKLVHMKNHSDSNEKEWEPTSKLQPTKSLQPTNTYRTASRQPIKILSQRSGSRPCIGAQTMPVAIRGVNFLSGGQTLEGAAARLNAINQAGGRKERKN